MTAETTGRPVRKESFRQRMVRRWIMLATVTEVLGDRRFQEKAITVVIGAVALAQLGRDNQARPLRRATSWYSKLGVKEEVDRVRDALEPGVDRVRDALEPGVDRVRDALEPGVDRVRDALEPGVDRVREALEPGKSS